MKSQASRFLDAVPAGSAVLSVVISYALYATFPMVRVDSGTFSLLGYALGAGALALIVYSAMFFMKEKTTLRLSGTPTALIVEGPYRYSRNPMYLGQLLITVGAAMSFGALSAFIPPVLYFLVVDRFVVPKEEAALRQAFGEGYAAFSAGTPRWMSRRALRTVIVIFGIALLIALVRAALSVL